MIEVMTPCKNICESKVFFCICCNNFCETDGKIGVSVYAKGYFHAWHTEEEVKMVGGTNKDISLCLKKY